MCQPKTSASVLLMKFCNVIRECKCCDCLYMGIVMLLCNWRGEIEHSIIQLDNLCSFFFVCFLVWRAFRHLLISPFRDNIRNILNWLMEHALKLEIYKIGFVFPSSDADFHVYAYACIPLEMWKMNQSAWSVQSTALDPFLVCFQMDWLQMFTPFEILYFSSFIHTFCFCK